MDLEQLVLALQDVEDAGDLARLTISRPTLFGVEMVDHLRGMAANEEIAPFVGAYLRLVEEATRDPARAWHEYKAALNEFEGGGGTW